MTDGRAPGAAGGAAAAGEQPVPPPVLDVIIPCYNQGHFLQHAIEAALGQTHPATTVTVVDDGSTDDTAVVAGSYGDRIQYVRVPHRGLSAARNAGLRATQGEYVLFLDADDLLAPDAAQRHLTVAADHPSAAATHSGWMYVEEPGGSPVEVDAYPLDEDPFHMILRGYCPPPNALVVRRDALEQAGPFDESLRLQEDRDMWLRIAAPGSEFVRVDGHLAWYRRHPASMSASAPKSLELTATVAVIRKARRLHAGCPTCKVLVPRSLEEWRARKLGQMKNDLLASGRRGRRLRTLLSVAEDVAGTPSLVPAAIGAGGRQALRRWNRGAGPDELVAFAHALRLSRRAQGVGGRSSLSLLAPAMAGAAGLPRGLDEATAVRATIRACTRGSRWFGQRDTCLIRSLVLGSLLADRDDVLLHVGFAPGPAGGAMLEGHAWVTVGGEVVGGGSLLPDGDRSVVDVVVPMGCRARKGPCREPAGRPR